MLPGILEAGDVRSFTTRVLVEGVSRPVQSVSLDGEMRPDLPAQISRASGSLARGGSISWASEEDVTDTPVTPFRESESWRPRKGQRVVVMQGDGVSEWVRFTGLIDETTGTIGSGMSSTVVVDIDRLSESFECEAHLAVMPPLAGSTSWRNAGLSPMYFVDAAMRAGKYYTTPPTISTSVLHVPFQSSMLPALGTQGEILSGSAHTGNSAFQENWPASWGMSAGNFKASYSPRLAYGPTIPVQISLMVTPAHADTGDVIVHYGGVNNYLRLVVGATGNAVLQRLRGSTTVEVCRITGIIAAGATRVEVVVRGGNATMRTNTGQSATGIVSGLLDQPMSRIDISGAPGARIAGVQVSNPEAWEDFINLNHVSTARIRTHEGNTTTWGVTNSSPRFEQAEAQTVLTNLADATLSGMWVDELGVLNFAPSNGIRSNASVQTITTADDVLAMAWSDRLLATASRVTIGYLHPALKNGSLRSIEVARGSNQGMRSLEKLEDIYTPGADEEWIGVDETLTVLGTGIWGVYNDGIGTLGGVTYTAQGETTSSAGLTVSISMTKTGLSEYTIKHEAGTFPADVLAEAVTSPVSADLWPRNRDKALPVIRAYAYLKWVAREVTRQTTMLGPVLRVDLGGQAGVTTAERVRDYLHGIVSNPYPQITSLEVVPDPRRQIGDVITLQSENFLGVTLRCLITSISESMAEEHTQSLGAEVLAVTTGSLTWGEWENAFPGTLSYEQWEALRGPADTYDDFNTNPLKGA